MSKVVSVSGAFPRAAGLSTFISASHMSFVVMKVDKPAALGKAPETETTLDTLDVTRDVGDTLRYT